MLADDVGRHDLHAADLPRTVGHGAAGLLGEPQDLARERGEPPPAGRERDAPARAHEEVVAELPAQRADRDGDRRLGDLELGRSRLHGPVPGHEDEGLQLRERHAGPPS